MLTNVRVNQQKDVDKCDTCKLKHLSDLLSEIVIAEINKKGQKSLNEIGRRLIEKDRSCL